MTVNKTPYRLGMALIVMAAVGPLSVRLLSDNNGKSSNKDDVSQGSSSGKKDAFHDHSDEGDEVQVLPAPGEVRSATDTGNVNAPVKSKLAVYPASYGKGNLTYHGGKILSQGLYYPVYWNSAVSGSNKTSLGYPDMKSQIAAFVTNFSNNPDYIIIQQYTGSNGLIAPSLPFSGSYIDTKAFQSTISDSSIRSYLTGLFQAGKFPAQVNALYGIYFPSGMKVQLQGGLSCSSFCGYHSHFTYNNVQIKYAVYPFPDCPGCQIPGKSVADMLTIISSHEIREAATDPGDSNVNAWYDAAGYEADDKCAWHNMYQMQSGGFWVQPEFSNAAGGCVVP